MLVQHELISRQVLSMLDNELRREEIEATLVGQGHEPGFVQQLVAATIQNRNLKRRAQGMMLILAGAVVCLSSCIITLVGGQGANSLPYVLYGLTTLGVLVVFVGLMKIF